MQFKTMKVLVNDLEAAVIAEQGSQTTKTVKDTDDAKFVLYAVLEVLCENTTHEPEGR